MASLLPGNILYAGPATFDEATNCRSLGHFCMEKFKFFKNKILMIDAMTGEKFTAKMLYESTVRLAHALRGLGIQSGDVVGISSENRFEFAVTLYASFAVNATVAPVNVTYSEREMHHAIGLSKPKIMFASEQTLHRVTKVSENSSIEHIVLFGSSNSSSKVLSFETLMKNPRNLSQVSFSCPIANKEEDVALIVCSSGTTGLPKGVQLTQKNILIGINPSQVELTSFSLGDLSILAVIPWFHIFGCLTLLTAGTMGSTLIFLPRFIDHEFLRAIEKYRIMMAYMVPPLMVFLAKHPSVAKYDLSSLKVLFCGAAPLRKDTEDLIKKRLGTVIIRQGYGLSETTRGVMIQTDKNCKPGSVGALKKGIYAKVVDPNTGKVLGPNERGELCFKGDYIMKGYIGDIQSTQTVVHDGWLHTGDIGYFDDDFEFFIVDRIKELIKYKGFQVPPAEIEALLLMNPKVKDAAVIGKPDEEAGELPMAFVVKQDDVHLSEDEIIKFVADRASPAKRLRGGVVFINEIPKNPSGKILRRVLHDILKRKHMAKL